ncbi:MAG: metallophosphoesterase [Planctomycetaceae bacterium]|nr:metallophosphoesterase [Planctomycetales bacterium]MCB9874290.1 metallophosphoesterase [Planctomycetaceae bacterium]HRX80209.1 metallophosphoesterase [Pirellulaceae bacterium]
MLHTLPNPQRRSFLHDGSLFLLAAGTGVATLSDTIHAAEEAAPELRFGVITDLHYADKPTAGSRHYRETLAKLADARVRFAQANPEFVVELGDFIDAADSVEVELSYLQRINSEFVKLPGEKHYVLGNHCVTTLNKEEFLAGVVKNDSFYSFDVRDTHFVVLDSCFRSDGQPYGRHNFEWTDANIPASEIEWLRSDLKSTTKRTIVFAHQRLDVENHYGVKNAPRIRKILEDSGLVQVVFQGHSHKNDHQRIQGIHYCTMVAMVEGSGAENNGYSTIDLLSEGVIRVSGYCKQAGYDWGL